MHGGIQCCILSDIEEVPKPNHKCNFVFQIGEYFLEDQIASLFELSYATFHPVQSALSIGIYRVRLIA